MFVNNNDKGKGGIEPVKTENSKPKRLSKRELQILKMASDGLKTMDISEKLFLSPNTVETHRKNIIIKLKANNIVHAVAKSIRTGIIR